MRDSEFLQWLHDRLINVHNENDLYDYMHRLREIVVRTKIHEELSDNMTREAKPATCEELDEKSREVMRKFR